MNKKKLLVIAVSVLLIVCMAVPGTFALETETPEATEAPIAPEATPAPEATDAAPAPEASAESTAAAEVKECTCDPKPAEGAAHQETCPLYVAHAEGCTGEECTAENCECACHLYDKLMACTTLDEIWAILDACEEDDFAFLTEEQNTEIDEKITALEPEPAPAIVIEESEPPVPSEIGYETVNFTNVAPLGEPVTGGNE